MGSTLLVKPVHGGLQAGGDVVIIKAQRGADVPPQFRVVRDRVDLLAPLNNRHRVLEWPQAGVIRNVKEEIAFGQGKVDQGLQGILTAFRFRRVHRLAS